MGDVDGDGVPEIVAARATTDPTCPEPNYPTHCASDQTLELRGADGALLWSRSVDVARDRDNTPAALIADINRDGSPDVVSATGASLYVFEADGTPVTGSPVTVSVEPFNPGDPAPTSCWSSQGKKLSRELASARFEPRRREIPL